MMKRLLAFLLCCAAVSAAFALSGCELIVADATASYVGATATPLAPAVVAALATPAPTPTPQVTVSELNATLFRRDGVSATVTRVTYTESQSVCAAVSIENRTAQTLSFSSTVPGAVNGWSLPFSVGGLSDGADSFAVLPEEVQTLTLTCALDAGTAERMQLSAVQTLNLSFSGTLGEANFAPGSNTIENPACDAAYVQSHADGAPLLMQGDRARYYFCGLDPVAATLYVAAECLGEPFDMTVLPRVNGYALGTRGVFASFAPGATHVMLTVPLLETVRTFAVNPIDNLSLSVLTLQKGRPVGADTVPVLVRSETADSQNVPPDEAPPAYIGAGRGFYRGNDVQIYYEAFQTEPSDYYGKITRYSLVCVNNTGATLYPNATQIKLAGAVMDGGFTGSIPPYSQTHFDFCVYANVKPGAEVSLEMELLDSGAKLRKLVTEAVAFTS